MSLPAVLFAARGLARDTFFQARASGIIAGFFIVTLLCAFFCLTVEVAGTSPQLDTHSWENAELIPPSEAQRLLLDPSAVRSEGVDVPEGELRLLFGAIRVPLRRAPERTVRLVQVFLAGGVADTAGVLLALLWTASFLPGFLEPASVSVMLAKPVSRGWLIAGKAVAVVAAVGAQAGLFVLATWLALGVRTGLWDLSYFLAVPILLLHFGAFFAMSLLFAVTTRSTVVCALSALIIWGACFAVNYARHNAVLGPTASAAPALEAAYTVLPKPLDYNLMLGEALGAGGDFRQAIDAARLGTAGAFAPASVVATGLAFASAITGLSAALFRRQDY